MGCWSSERLVKYALGIGFFLSLGFMILNPLGHVIVLHIGGRPNTLHSVTVFGAFFTCLFFYSFLKGKVWKRVTLTAVFLFLVYMLYDVTWDSFYTNCLSQISSSLVPRSFSVVWVTANWEGVAVRWILLAIPLIVLTLKVPSSKIQLRGVFLVFIIDLAMVYWLESTGFFQRFYFFWVFQNTPGFHGPPDPEGWVWFTGKLTSFLVAPLMVLDHHRLHKHKAEKNKESEFSQEILKEEVS